MATDDKFLVQEFNRVLKRNADKAYVNLDDKFTGKFEFFVQTAEEVLGEIGTTILPNRWSYHRLVLITEGYADYVCGIYRFKAVRNTLINIPARVITASQWLRTTSGFITLFSFDFFLQNHFSPKYLENKTILLPTAQPFLHLTDAQAA